MSCNFLLLAALFALASCSSEEKKANSGEKKTDSVPVLVTIDGTEITALDLNRYEKSLPDYLRSQNEGVDSHRAHLQSLIDKELVLREAHKRGIDRRPDLEQRLSIMVNRRIVDELAREFIGSRLVVTEEEMRNFYEEESLGWEVWPAHILSASEEDAREAIRLLESGVGFSKLASERSLADDAEQGGNLGAFFDGSGAVAALREGAFHLEEGQVSAPIRTIDGYEVIKVLKKRRVSFEQLSGLIAERLGRHRAEERRRAIIDSLGQARGLRYYSDRIHAVLDGLNNRGLDSLQAEDLLVEFAGGAITVGDAVVGLRDLEKGHVPPDSATALWVLEQRILPDSLLVLEARAQKRHLRDNIVAWREKNRLGLMAAQLRIDEVAGRVEVTEDEVRSYYEKYLDTYKNLPGIIKMTEVLCDTRAEAEAILARAQAGERLEELAVRHSVRSSMKPVGGHAFADSGRVTVASLIQSPYRTVFGDSNSQDVGVLQDPLEIQDKFSVFRLNQPFEKEPISFRQVRRPIRVDITKSREAVLFDAFLDSLHQAYAEQVEVDEVALSRYAATR
jgi:parvulin-like peptidyl-prolyl isomerase